MNKTNSIPNKIPTGFNQWTPNRPPVLLLEPNADVPNAPPLVVPNQYLINEFQNQNKFQTRPMFKKVFPGLKISIKNYNFR